MAYDNEKKFALFKNDKGDNQARPDYRGETTIDGKVYRISGWIADVKNGPKAGEKYIRGSIELDPKKNGAAPQQSTPPSDPSRSPYCTPANEGADESVPF